MSSTKTLDRMKQRVQSLTSQFAQCLDCFESTNLFTGPSLYFHRKTLQFRERHKSVRQLLDDREFFDYLYATLTAWGMHRMGPGNTKLAELDVIMNSFRSQADKLAELEGLNITALDSATAKNVTQKLWEVLARLKVGIGETKIVANSKALHHVLPDLIPPIDREYTIRFFYHHKTLNQGDEVAFMEIYPPLQSIAKASKDEIRTRLGNGMHTSDSKIVDNAIVGFVCKFLRENDQATTMAKDNFT